MAPCMSPRWTGQTTLVRFSASSRNGQCRRPTCCSPLARRRSGAKPSSSSTSTNWSMAVVGAGHLRAASQRRIQLSSPRPPGGQRLGARILVGGERHGQYLGEQPVVPRSAAVHLPDRAEHQRWTPRPFTARLDLFHLAVADQAVEVEADGVGMHAQHIGDRDDGQRIAGCSQYPQHLPAATGGFPDRRDMERQGPSHSFSIVGFRLGGHQRCVDAQRTELGRSAR